MLELFLRKDASTICNFFSGEKTEKALNKKIQRPLGCYLFQIMAGGTNFLRIGGRTKQDRQSPGPLRLGQAGFQPPFDRGGQAGVAAGGEQDNVGLVYLFGGGLL